MKTGLQTAFLRLQEDVSRQYGTKIRTLSAMGVSAMMHGYLAFDRDMKLLVPFRTWRNTITKEAREELSSLFKFNIPERWTIAHVREAMLKNEPHVPKIARVTTLAGYVHYLLTGVYAVGIGEASGIMPIDSVTKDYDEGMVRIFDGLAEKDGFLNIRAREIFPKVLLAGEDAGTLTEAGARYLDPEGTLLPGTPLCPPEGDAGTGMTATNSVAKKTGNVSAGTSVFSMVVLEKALSGYYEEIDMVTTPDGSPVAMVHCNNCTSDINAWMHLFKETLALFGKEVSSSELFTTLFMESLKGAPDTDGLVHVNYVSGESITGFTEGMPLVLRRAETDFSPANFMRSMLYSAIATLKLGNDILRKKENVAIDTLYGHGGFFKTKGVGQKFLADALDSPVSVMETAGEGGPWGMAILALYRILKEENESLGDFLNTRIFRGEKGETCLPDEEGVKGFERYTENYRTALLAEKAAVESGL